LHNKNPSVESKKIVGQQFGIYQEILKRWYVILAVSAIFSTFWPSKNEKAAEGSNSRQSATKLSNASANAT
jgi:hypothetical protein